MSVPSPLALAQYALPKRLLTRAAGALADARLGAGTQWAIRRFIARYGVDMGEAAASDPAAYATFNDFFTRALKPGARPLAPADFICPVDGALSACGAIERDQIFQAKGHAYSSTALLGGEVRWSAEFIDGRYATLYLSPRDYHRVHMPCAGRLVRMVYVPGDLFSVSPATAAVIPNLFARNERVVCLFETAHGYMALVLVGAAIVGGIATVWHGAVNAARGGKMQAFDYDAQDIRLAQGAEMGRFLLGSTVVLLWPRGAIAFPEDWLPGRPLRMGAAMGRSADRGNGA